MELVSLELKQLQGDRSKGSCSKLLFKCQTSCKKSKGLFGDILSATFVATILWAHAFLIAVILAVPRLTWNSTWKFPVLEKFVLMSKKAICESCLFKIYFIVGVYASCFLLTLCLRLRRFLQPGRRKNKKKKEKKRCAVIFTRESHQITAALTF